MITTESLFAILFMLGIIYGYTVNKYQDRPLQFRPPRPSKVSKVSKEEEETISFLAIMTDDTQDDLKLRQYKPRRKRNAAPLAITATAHPTSANMRSIQGWMTEHDMYNETRRMSRMT